MRNNYKNNFIPRPFGVFHLRTDTAGFLRFLAVAFASSSWPGICAARREDTNGGTRPRLDDKDHEKGTPSPIPPQLKRLQVELIQICLKET